MARRAELVNLASPAESSVRHLLGSLVLQGARKLTMGERQFEYRSALSPRRVRQALLATFLLLASLPSPASPQAPVVKGRILDGSSKQPITLAAVALLDTAMAVVAQALTNQNGTFMLEAPRPGSYFVLADRVGYKRAVDGILELQKGGSISIDFYLRPQPLVMDSLVVAAKRQRTIRHLAAVGYYERQQAGFGHFITPEQIERKPPFDATDLLKSIPGVRVLTGQAGATVVFTRVARLGGSFCTPGIYLDGARVADNATLDQIVSIDDIQAVEIYTGSASLPLEFGGTQAGCGALLIWTKM